MTCFFYTNEAGTTLYKCGRDLDIVSENLEIRANIAINWLYNNEMVADPKKVRLTFLVRNNSSEKEKRENLPAQLSY